ncbi:F-type conjugal transfer pilus assembly protein TraB [Escherichia coli]|uniref:F-type conjugal transfer pilus assembly protein TraB n=1 Tax=Escherichia coli TaxID=562 RepID=UPI00334655BF
MASINTIVKRKQYLWLGIVVVGAASAIGGALYLSDVDMSGNGETVAEQEPVPDMTGVVDTTFDDKVRQHATTEMQVTAAQMQKQYEEIRRELDVLNKQRGDDQRRIEKLGQDNAALAEQVKALGANPVTATGEPVPQTPASPPGPEGEPQPGNTPVSFPPQGSVAVPPPTAFYPGNGVTPPPQVTYQSVPVPNRIQRKVFTRNEGKQGPSLPYIPSGSFAKAMLIEGADANASVTGNESTVPMQLRITGLVEMPNSKTYDATGCFVGLEAWGDVSSERAIVRTRKAKDNKLTVSVGEFCSKKVLGVCLQKKRSYCQFDSKLAQIVQQQGRNGQLRIGFGSAKSPDCRGITVDELQKIQFDRLDFTNFYEDLMNNQKIPDSGVLTQKVKEQIADQLKQAGQ